MRLDANLSTNRYISSVPYFILYLSISICFYLFPLISISMNDFFFSMNELRFFKWMNDFLFLATSLNRQAPLIRPNEPDITVSTGKSVKFTCQSNEPIEWRFHVITLSFIWNQINMDNVSVISSFFFNTGWNSVSKKQIWRQRIFQRKQWTSIWNHNWTAPS